jgi:hypothetical protein
MEHENCPVGIITRAWKTKYNAISNKKITKCARNTRIICLPVPNSEADNYSLLFF